MNLANKITMLRIFMIPIFLIFIATNISYGIAVIVFTIIIRTCLLPLNLKQMRNQLKMTELQPELKKLQEKYKNKINKSEIINRKNPHASKPVCKV